jgi:hypothetical protein
VALETAFVETYLGAVKSLSSTDLKLTAAKVAANEARTSEDAGPIVGSAVLGSQTV